MVPYFFTIRKPMGLQEVERKSINESLKCGKGTLEVTRRLWGYKKVPLFGGVTSDLLAENNMYPAKYTTEGQAADY
jgi:DEAD/DEAH box helicase domain-containing protein